ncbi:MAG: murein L,D-transpeptidase, partial [Hyphomicrobiales bacterium]|nr:murein L,D-transpeptidase [Hyphomicrobiales bacterium]
MKISRRNLLASAGALAATTISGGAMAQDVIGDLLSAPKRGAWNDQFDARASEGGKV